MNSFVWGGNLCREGTRLKRKSSSSERGGGAGATGWVRSASRSCRSTSDGSSLGLLWALLLGGAVSNDNTFCTMRRQKRIKLIHKSSVLCEAMRAYCKYNMQVNMVIIACTHLWVQQQMLKGQQGKQKQQVLAERTQAHCHQKNQSALSWQY